MRVYCAAPIRGGLENKQFTDIIPSIIEEAGHTALSELSTASADRLSDKKIFNRDIDWLRESDCVVAEVSSPSSGVGFEIAYALYQLNIPVLALYTYTANVSAMIMGCSSPLLVLASYNNPEEMKRHIENFMNSVRMNVERERIF